MSRREDNGRINAFLTWNTNEEVTKGAESEGNVWIHKDFLSGEGEQKRPVQPKTHTIEHLSQTQSFYSWSLHFHFICRLLYFFECSFLIHYHHIVHTYSDFVSYCEWTSFRSSFHNDWNGKCSMRQSAGLLRDSEEETVEEIDDAHWEIVR